jgi:hypothetical protein
MKNLLIILFLTLFLTSCAVGDSGEVPPPPIPPVTTAPPTAPYVTCVEMYGMVQDCDTQ